MRWILGLVLVLCGCQADPLIGRRVRIIGTDVTGVVEGHPYAGANSYTITYADDTGQIHVVYLRPAALELVE